MKKMIAILLSIVLLGLVGCGGADEASESGNIEYAEAEDTSESFTGSMADLMARAVPMKCTWSVDTEGLKSEGVIYVKGDKYRTDIKGHGIEMHYISDGDYIYIWDSMRPQGTKISVEQMEDMGGDAASSDDVQTEDLNIQNLEGEYDYTCKPWIYSSSQFDVPSDVDFADMGEMMANMQDMADRYENDPCAMCDMVPEGEPRDECLASC